jgi:hypothetical protein
MHLFLFHQQRHLVGEFIFITALWFHIFPLSTESFSRGFRQGTTRVGLLEDEN